ncbi:MAG: squalene/phytoene synthase family protein [Rhodopila sp.]
MNEAIAALVRRHDPDRFLTALFAPPERRHALLTLYAFNHELARAREVASEPALALIRLQWWREVVEGASSWPGQGGSPSPQPGHWVRRSRRRCARSVPLTASPGWPARPAHSQPKAPACCPARCWRGMTSRPKHSSIVPVPRHPAPS